MSADFSQLVFALILVHIVEVVFCGFRTIASNIPVRLVSICLLNFCRNRLLLFLMFNSCAVPIILVELLQLLQLPSLGGIRYFVRILS